MSRHAIGPLCVPDHTGRNRVYVSHPPVLDSCSISGRIRKLHGAVAQLGERYNRTVEVRGSSPLSSTVGLFINVGPWLSWESTTMALWGSRVRVPPGPPTLRRQSSGERLRAGVVGHSLQRVGTDQVEARRPAHKGSAREAELAWEPRQ